MSHELPATEPSVAISMSQMYYEFRDLRDEVKHLASVVDPALSQIRADVSDNRARMDVLKAERVAADEALEVRVRSLETSGYVTSGRMWTAVGVLAALLAAAAAVAVLIIR